MGCTKKLKRVGSIIIPIVNNLKVMFREHLRRMTSKYLMILNQYDKLWVNVYSLLQSASILFSTLT